MMSSIVNYFLNVGIVSAIMYSFYRLVLHKLTFHSLNRFYLLFALAFSLVCPVLEINFSLHNSLNENSLWVEEFYELTEIKSETIVAGDLPQNYPITYFILLVYIAGVFAHLFRFSKQLWHIVQLKRQSTRIEKEGYKFYLTKNYGAPFSFFNWVILPANYADRSEFDSILEHEMVHSRQLHSLDLILTEIFCIAFWFNPFVFLLKKSLKTTHEYLADRCVVEQHGSLHSYLNLLVSSAEIRCFSGITNHFQSLTLKKRIKMISKNKTSKYIKFSYLLIIPIVVVSILGFGELNVSVPEIAQQKPVLIENPPSIKPIKESDITRIASRYGIRVNPLKKNEKMMHYGIDITAKMGTPVLATASGKIVKVTFDKGHGNLIAIQHDDTYTTFYSHLSEFAVKIDDVVKQGDVIGKVGNTGLSTGPHLHYEVRKNGERVNPEGYFE